MEETGRKFLFWFVILVFLFIVALVVRVSGVSHSSSSGASASRNLFPSQEIIPLYPQPAPVIPEVTNEGFDIQVLAPVVFTPHTGNLEILLRVAGIPPYSPVIVVDDYPLSRGFSVTTESNNLTLSFDEEIQLADGIRTLVIYLTDGEKRTVSVSIQALIESPEVRTYRETVLQWAQTVEQKFPADASLDRETLNAYVQFLLLPIRYGSIPRASLQGELARIEKALYDSRPTFWKALYGKPLTELEIRLVARVFQKNLAPILLKVEKASGTFVSPFVSLNDLSRKSTQILGGNPYSSGYR